MSRRSSIFGVWAAPGGRETFQKGGGRSPPSFWKVSRPPGTAQTPKIDDFRSVKKSDINYAMLCTALHCYAMLRYVMLCYAMPRYAMLCFALLCYALSAVARMAAWRISDVHHEI